MMHSTLGSVLKRCAIVFLSVLAFAARAQSSSGTQQMWLLVNPYAQESLIAEDPAEKDSLIKNSWQINGTANFVTGPRKDTTPVNRLSLSGANGVDRVFSASSAELARAIKAGYNNEAMLGYASTKEKDGLVPVYHFTRESKNLYLIKTEDRAWAEKNGWKFDAIVFWLWPVSS